MSINYEIRRQNNYCTIDLCMMEASKVPQFSDDDDRDGIGRHDDGGMKIDQIMSCFVEILMYYYSLAVPS